MFIAYLDITMFIVLQNTITDVNYSMLLRRPWLRDAIITHDWANNTMTNQRNGMVKAIMVIYKHLGIEVKKIKMLLCYNYQNGIINEKEEDIIFTIEPKLFFIGIISLLNTF
jgi:hypothetical protein